MPTAPPAHPRAFFVYGTLLRGEPNHRVIARLGLAGVRAARVRGRLFDTGEGYPAMLAPLEPRAGQGGDAPAQGAGVVAGELMVPADLAAALRDLDALEEFFGPGDPHNLYERREVEADTGEGAPVRAWAYLYVGTARLVPIPSGDWKAHQQGVGP
ncbi:gamma-glutamylcyclotransferase family protein [Ramlibacter sp. MAHUQ-53]|uniref:gamma-glutamylcyclotransferase family protein n=1 Tax=unclassified Ramlibacter TaxID=2617605 RepID=UPI003639204F